MDEAALRCEGCGYPRIGIDAAARCPECGDAPPRRRGTASAIVGSATSAGEQRWLLSVASGLVLLCVCYAFALHSELFFNQYAEALPTINATGPKLAAAAGILRQIGDPGPNGVRGMLAALGGVLAIVLITTPTHRNDNTLLRHALRISSVGCMGALFAYLIARGLPTHRDFFDIRYQYTFAIGGVELPVNVLLYAYLARLSRRTDASGRGAERLHRAMILVALATGGGGAIRLAERFVARDVGPLWLIVQFGYGVLMLGAGIVMTFAVTQLTWQYLRAAFATPPAWWRRLRSVGVLRWGMLVFRRSPRLCAAVLGIALLCYATRPGVALTLGEDPKLNEDWRLGIVNFLGPRMQADPLRQLIYIDRGETVRLMFITLIAVWLITMHRPPTWRWLSPRVVRWTIVLLIAVPLSMGLHLTQRSYQSVSPLFREQLQAGTESIATLLIYAYLARIAAGFRGEKLARNLSLIGVAAGVLIALPAITVEVPLVRWLWDRTPAMVAGFAAYGSIVMCISMLAWLAIGRLVWRITREILRERAKSARLL